MQLGENLKSNSYRGGSGKLYPPPPPPSSNKLITRSGVSTNTNSNMMNNRILNFGHPATPLPSYYNEDNNDGNNSYYEHINNHSYASNGYEDHVPHHTG